MRRTEPTRSAYAIFITTLCQGTVPLWYDDKNLPITYATQREAQIEIAEDLAERLRQFLAGERDFDDAITIEEFILPVDVWPDGSISTEVGTIFGRRRC